MDPATIGGIFIISGSVNLYRGNMLLSTLSYLIADVMWILLAYQAGNFFGMFTLGVGMLFVAGVYYKMQTGKFVKDLKNPEHQPKTEVQESQERYPGLV